MQSALNAQADFFYVNQACEEDRYFDATGAWWEKFGDYLRAYTEHDSEPIRTLSLFSGAGGLDIGFHDCGFDIVEAVEIDPKLAASLRANTGEGKYFGKNTKICIADICQYSPQLEGIDFIIGGPPCQTFSAAGARASGVSGTKDFRGNLFQEYVRILKTLKPMGFLFENVYRILGANGGKDWQAIKKAFYEAGYDLTYRVLDTADYGVPQNRERLIIVGVRKDIPNISYKLPRPTHGPDSRAKRKQTSSAQALSGVTEVPDKHFLGGKYGHLLAEVPPGLNYSFFTEKMGHPTPIFSWRSKFSDFLYKADPYEPVRTIKAQGGQYTGPFHWDSRPFSRQEYKRLQTFPDSYELVGSKATVIKQIGNSVPPQFARLLALSIRDQIFKKPIPIEVCTIDASASLSFRKMKSVKTAKYRKVAYESIAKMSPPAAIKTDGLPSDLQFDLSDDFAISIRKNARMRSITSVSEKIISFDVSSGASNENIATITIRPVKTWALSAAMVILRFDSLSWKSFVASWKIFELYLSKNDLKADLEQLSGYYQYAPRIKCDLQSSNQNAFRMIEVSFLKRIISGELTQRNLSLADIAKETGLSQDLAYAHLKALKASGYAVRSSNTNASIDKGVFLIPYSFPTLNPLSVQLNKDI